MARDIDRAELRSRANMAHEREGIRRKRNAQGWLVIGVLGLVFWFGV